MPALGSGISRRVFTSKLAVYTSRGTQRIFGEQKRGFTNSTDVQLGAWSKCEKPSVCYGEKRTQPVRVGLGEIVISGDKDEHFSLLRSLIHGLSLSL